MWASLATALVFAGSAAASFPGTNGKIAFVRGAGSDTNIFTIDPNGQNLVPLTHAPDFGRNQNPSFSGDGQWIAFDSFVSGGAENPSIWVMKHDGTDQTQLTSGLQYDYDPGFSPDGERIAFVRDSGSVSHIWVMNAGWERPDPDHHRQRPQFCAVVLAKWAAHRVPAPEQYGRIDRCLGDERQRQRTDPADQYRAAPPTALARHGRRTDSGSSSSARPSPPRTFG